MTSDCGAISDIFGSDRHHWAPDAETATAAGLKAGCDTDCGGRSGGVYGRALVSAVNRSILSEATIDQSLVRLAKIQMKLGLFEPKDEQVYFDQTKYGIFQVDTPEHRQLAYEAALQSVVLLQNKKKTLPLKKGTKIALVGPHFDGQEVFLSSYHGSRCTNGRASPPSPPPPPSSPSPPPSS